MIILMFRCDYGKDYKKEKRRDEFHRRFYLPSDHDTVLICHLSQINIKLLGDKSHHEEHIFFAGASPRPVAT